jgi:hypothetical protein
MTRYRIERISGAGLPERFQEKLFDSVEEAVKVATQHHDGKFQIVSVPAPDALGPELEGPLEIKPRPEPEPPPPPPDEPAAQPTAELEGHELEARRPGRGRHRP